MFSNSQENHVFTSNDYFIDNKSNFSKNIKYDVIDSGQFEKNNENINYNHTSHDNYINSMKNEYDSNFNENSDRINYGSFYQNGNIKNPNFSNKNNSEDIYNQFAIVNNSSKKELNTNCHSNFQENSEIEKNYLKSNFSNMNKNSTSENYKTNTLSSKESKLISTKPNDSFNYNSELKYYRDVVEKMHSEINSLNNKLNELDKTNSLSLSNAHKPYKYSKISSDAENYEMTKDYIAYNPIKYVDTLNPPYSEKNLNEIKLNYNYCTDPSQKAIETTFNENTLESINNKEDNFKNSTNHFKFDYNNQDNNDYKFQDNSKNSESIAKRIPSKSSSNTNMNEKNEKISKVIMKSPNMNQINGISDYNINKRINKFKKSNSRFNSNDVKNTSKDSKNKLTSKSKQSRIPKISKIKEKKSKSVSNKSSEDLSEITKQNQILKSQVKFLEKKLDDVSDKLKLDQIERRGKDHLRIELEKWKFKTEALSKNYLQTLNNMKKQILDDKAMFVEKIKIMESENREEIESLKNKYQGFLERQENKIKQYKKENEILKKKLSKVKEILI